MAALYGQNGTGWMWSEGFPDLNQNTSVTIEGLSEADTKVIQVNEFDTVLKASGGERKPSEAGIRIGGEKYMMVTHDAETGLA